MRTLRNSHGWRRARRLVAVCLGSACGRERSIEVWRLWPEPAHESPAEAAGHTGGTAGTWPARLGAVNVRLWAGWAPDLALDEAAGVQLMSAGWAAPPAGLLACMTPHASQGRHAQYL